MLTCPSCQSTTRQVKHGGNPSGSQRYLCQDCKRTDTPAPTAYGYGYDAATREHALRLYADGMNLRRIARHLGVVHQTVVNWVAAHADALPDQPPQSRSDWCGREPGRVSQPQHSDGDQPASRAKRPATRGPNRTQGEQGRSRHVDPDGSCRAMRV